MRILHVIDSLRLRRGGPPMIAASLAAAQGALGHDVQLLSYAHADAPQTGDFEPISREIPGWQRVEHVRLPLPALWESMTARAARKALEARCRGADVVHLHRVWEPLMPVTARWCRKRRIPYLILLNGMLHPWSLSRSRIKKKIALALGYRRMLEGAAALHVGNSAEREAVTRLGIRARIVEIPNGVWLEEPPLPAGVFRRDHPQLGGDPFILFLGRLHQKKGLDILIQAFAELHRSHPHVRLVIAGDDSGARPELERAIAASGLQEHALLVGPIYGAHKRAALAEAACFCLSSRQEGFPVAVLEALAAGLPAIISHECHFPQVQASEAGFVLPLVPEEFSSAMRSVLDGEPLRRRMSSNARQMIQRDYTWPRIAQQTLEAYQSVLAR